MTFPEDFPSLCPPGTARRYAGPYYRLVWENPGDPDDPENHKSHRELGKKYPSDQECDACGLSGCMTEEGIKAFRNRLGERVKKVQKMSIMLLSLEVDDGKFLETPRFSDDPHCSFWAFNNIDIRKRRVNEYEPSTSDR